MHPFKQLLDKLTSGTSIYPKQDPVILNLDPYQRWFHIKFRSSYGGCGSKDAVYRQVGSGASHNWDTIRLM
jgi:hypothetical protein